MPREVPVMRKTRCGSRCRDIHEEVGAACPCVSRSPLSGQGVDDQIPSENRESFTFPQGQLPEIVPLLDGQSECDDDTGARGAIQGRPSPSTFPLPSMDDLHDLVRSNFAGFQEDVQLLEELSTLPDSSASQAARITIRWTCCFDHDAFPLLLQIFNF